MRSVLLFLLIIARIDTINAQPVKLLAHIGAGISYNSKQRSDNYYMQATRFKPAMYYKAALALQVPIANHIAFETGIGYERRNIRSVQDYNTTNGLSQTNNVKINYHYIALPMQLSMCLYQSKQKQFWITAGFNYGFLIKAKTCVSTELFIKGKSINNPLDQCFNPRIILSRAPSVFSTEHPYGSMYAFDVATSLGLSYTMTPRIAIRAHYNYSLYNTEITTDGNIHQHNTGLSFLFRLI
jgi:hypothetical protein